MPARLHCPRYFPIDVFDLLARSDQRFVKGRMLHLRSFVDGDAVARAPYVLITPHTRRAWQDLTEEARGTHMANYAASEVLARIERHEGRAT